MLREIYSFLRQSALFKIINLYGDNFLFSRHNLFDKPKGLKPIDEFKMKIKMMALNGVAITIASLVVNAAGVDAWGNDNDDEAVSMNELQSFWVDAMDVLADLDSYDKLWIKPHSCVWSECAVDDTDDGYMGDNRDGDEQWYQYRTQGFCANAAYSLYGRKKEDAFLPSFNGCSRRHFINSFFTYGGADNLLKAIGESPVVYTYDGNGDDDGGGNNDDYDGSSVNSACTEIEYEGSDDYVSGNDDENSNSGSNDNDEYSGTLGCSADGSYVIAAFQSSSCDGNYFAGIVDEFEEYNKQHNSIGCHKIYHNHGEVSTESVYMLLNNSWSCDLRLYPNGCPDPYGKKEKFDFAMRTVAHGGNPHRAYQNMVLKTPLHVTSWTLLVITVILFVITYLVKNESRAIQSKGGRNILGYLRCLGEDMTIGCHNFGRFIMGESKKKKKKKKSKRHKKNSDEKKFSNGSEHGIDTTDCYVHVNDDIES